MKSKKKPIVNIGDRFGKLVVITEPYLIQASIHNNGKPHNRQHVDCLCDCGNIKEKVSSTKLKSNTFFTYCSVKCKLYLEDNPLSKLVPEDSKLVKLGDRINNLTVIEEAFYNERKGHSFRSKFIKAKCDCGNIKEYREDKFAKGLFKSCGCVWKKKEKTGIKKHCKYCDEYKDSGLFASPNKCDQCAKIKQITNCYGISEKEYKNLLTNQNYKCKICLLDQAKSSKGTLCVDHCHSTGKVRGLLCDQCNFGLGTFKDNILFLEEAIKYLKENG